MANWFTKMGSIIKAILKMTAFMEKVHCFMESVALLIQASGPITNSMVGECFTISIQLNSKALLTTMILIKLRKAGLNSKVAFI